MSRERRLRKRVTLSVYLPATDTHINAPLGHIIDINAGGFLLLSEQPLAPSCSYSVNIQLPSGFNTSVLGDEQPGDTTADNNPVINVIAQVVRSQPSVKPHFYESAFEISYASVHTKRIIERLQQHYHLHMPQQY